MVYVVATTKGGEGKTVIAFNVLPILIGDDNVKIVEIDNHNNTSVLYKNDNYFKNMKTVKVNVAEDELDDLFYEAIVNNENIVIDAGGGDDTKTVLEYLRQQPTESVKYIIPISPGSDDLNPLQTYKQINKPEQTLFILNGYHDSDKLEDEFMYFFGNKNFDVIGVCGKINKPNFIKIPFDNLFKISKLSYSMTISTLAAQAKSYKNSDEAYADFLKKSKGDKEKHKVLFKTYKASLKAGELVESVKRELELI
jgi:hypothetical protein